MARKNKVTLWGKLLDDPQISFNRETMEPQKASFFLAVVNQDRDSGINDDIIYSEPFVYTQDTELIKDIMEWKKSDLVDVRGVISTFDAKKAAICPHCGNRLMREGEVTLITPTFCERRYTGLSDKEADEILKKHREISNIVELTGYLCADVREQKKAKVYGDIISRMSYKGLAQYQIAVNRHLFIKSDNPMTKTDYPHIVSIGENAEEDILRLHESSLVSIEGMVATRNFRRSYTCPVCSEKFDRNEKVTEVLTYSTEYLNNYNEFEGNAAEEKERRKNEMLAEAERKLHNS